MKTARRLVIALVIVLLIVADIVNPFKVSNLHIELAAEPIICLGGYTITNTLISSWLAMVLLIVLALFVRRSVVDTPKAASLQNIVEAACEALHNYMQNIVGPSARRFFPVVATFFLFIATSNWLGLLPGFTSIGIWEVVDGHRVLVPLLRGTTSDLNTTLALAVCSVVCSQVFGIRVLGAGEYLSRFVPLSNLKAFVAAIRTGEGIKPGLLFSGFLDLFIGLFEVFDELTKILSFSFRLFGNVFGGEVLLVVIAFLAPYLASLPFLIMELFFGFIQAFIFSVLSTAFFGRAVTSHHHDEAHDGMAPETPLPQGSQA